MQNFKEILAAIEAARAEINRCCDILDAKERERQNGNHDYGAR